MRRILSVFLLLFPTAWAMAQQCTAYSVVSAIDRKTGDDIDDLNASDFEAQMGKSPLQVVSATQNFNNRVLVLLETDGTKSERVEDAVTLVTRMARQAPDGRRLAFGVFSQRAKFSKGFNPDAKQRSAEISELIEEAPELGSSVALFDALHDAIALFGPREPGDTVVLISDAFDEASKHGSDAVEKEFEASGIRLLVMMRQPLSHVTGNFIWKPPERDREVLERMSARTGGIYTMFNAALFSFAWRGYLLEVALPEGVSKPHPWKLRLGEGAAEEHRRTSLYYPERLPGCPGALAQAH
jgi:hypothetical protein